MFQPLPPLVQLQVDDKQSPSNLIRLRLLVLRDHPVVNTHFSCYPNRRGCLVYLFYEINSVFMMMYLIYVPGIQKLPWF